MAHLTITIHGRPYTVACDDGEEDQSPEHALRNSATVPVDALPIRQPTSVCNFAHSYVCSPVRFGPEITIDDAMTQPVLRAVDHIIQDRITLAWVSVESQTGSPNEAK